MAANGSNKVVTYLVPFTLAQKTESWAASLLDGTFAVDSIRAGEYSLASSDYSERVNTTMQAKCHEDVINKGKATSLKNPTEQTNPKDLKVSKVTLAPNETVTDGNTLAGTTPKETNRLNPVPTAVNATTSNVQKTANNPKEINQDEKSGNNKSIDSAGINNHMGQNGSPIEVQLTFAEDKSYNDKYYWAKYAPQTHSSAIDPIVAKYNSKTDNVEKTIGKSRKDPVPASIFVKSINYEDQNQPYSNFILMNVSDSNAEAYQLIETLGRDLFYSIGSRPVVMSFSGLLLNTDAAEWKRDFEKLYETKLRAGANIDNGTRVYIAYDNVVVEGLVLNLSTTISSSSPNDSSFSLSLYVTNKKYIGR